MIFFILALIRIRKKLFRIQEKSSRSNRIRIHNIAFHESSSQKNVKYRYVPVPNEFPKLPEVAIYGRCPGPVVNSSFCSSLQNHFSFRRTPHFLHIRFLISHLLIVTVEGVLHCRLRMSKKNRSPCTGTLIFQYTFIVFKKEIISLLSKVYKVK